MSGMNEDNGQETAPQEAAPAWFTEYKETQDAKIKTIEEENLRLQGELRGRTTAEPEYNENLPQTAREWQMAQYGLTRSVQVAQQLHARGELSDDEQAMVNAISSEQQNASTSYNQWQRKNAAQEAERETKEAAFNQRIEEAGLAPDSEDRRIMEAAFKGGADAPMLDAIVLMRRQVRENSAGMSAHERTSAAQRAGSQIEPGGGFGSEPRPHQGSGSPVDGVVGDIAKRVAGQRSSEDAVFSDEWSG